MTNPYMQSLVSRISNRYAVDRSDMSMSEWIETNTRHNKRAFNFDGYEFQRQIVDDMHPNLSVMKCSQIGLTEVQIRKSLGFLVRNQGVKAIYTMPNEKMFKRVSKARIVPIIKGSPVFNPEGSEDWSRSMDMQQFDQSWLYITGATEGDATSIDADAVFNDEVDLTNETMLALFNSRMQNSQWRLNQSFSTPTHVGYGINKQFNGSDQHQLLCLCRACNHWNLPAFDQRFVRIPGLSAELNDLSEIDERIVGKLALDEAFIACEKCGRELDLDEAGNRQYVPTYTELSKVSRGYALSPFCTSRLNIEYIVGQLLKYKERNFLRGWYNTVLGEPFTDANARLSEVEIKVNLLSPSIITTTKTEPIVVGIDSGLVCHVVIARISGEVIEMHTIRADRIEAWIADLAENRNIVGGCMDRHPYTPTAHGVFEASKGKIFPVEYRGSKEINAIKNESDEITHFQANRTDLLDMVAKRIRRKQLPISGYGRGEHIVVQHLRNMVRDEAPEQEAVWKKLSEEDHWFHALGFMLFSFRINKFKSSLNESDPRSMINVMSVNIQSTGDSLYGSTNRMNNGQLGLQR